jgi:hypothetical protein
VCVCVVVTNCSSAVMLSISKTLKAPASAVARGYRTMGVSVRGFSGVPPTPHASTSMDQMMSDKRYTPVSAVPSSLIDDAQSDMVHSPGFSIKGQAKAGRPAYLDFQATTPTDPRVVDAMVCVLPTHIHTCIHTHSHKHSLAHSLISSKCFFSCHSCLENMEIPIQEPIPMGKGFSMISRLCDYMISNIT